jgi:hypothetical protein
MDPLLASLIAVLTLTIGPAGVGAALTIYLIIVSHR